MTQLTAKLAISIACKTIEKGKSLGFAPLCCVVLDRGGHALALMRDENSSVYRPEIATAKASGCIGMGFGGRELAKRAALMPMFFNGLQTSFPKGMLPVPGGLLLRDEQGEILGAVGVTGDTSDNDEIAALAAIEGSGLIADTGA